MKAASGLYGDQRSLPSPTPPPFAPFRSAPFWQPPPPKWVGAVVGCFSATSFTTASSSGYWWGEPHHNESATRSGPHGDSRGRHAGRAAPLFNSRGSPGSFRSRASSRYGCRASSSSMLGTPTNAHACRSPRLQDWSARNRHSASTRSVLTRRALRSTFRLAGSMMR